MKIKKILDYQLYLQREDDFFHAPYEQEQYFYQMIRQGNLQAIQEMKEKYGKTSESPKGKLSVKPVKNEFYHFIINTAVITRTCIDGGLPQETAYTLSDLYIRKGEACKTISEIRDLNDEMVWEFTGLMKDLRTKQVISLQINRSIDYIHNHLHQKITVELLAAQVGLHPNYFSTLFKKETGISVSDYIRNKRLETAENMLRYSSFSCADIAMTLCFSSQSHFIRLFKEKNGITPTAYRNRAGEL